MQQAEQLLVISKATSYFSLQYDIYTGFLTNSIFKTPIEKTSLKALSRLAGNFKNLIINYYSPADVQPLIDLFAQSNNILVEYVYYLVSNYPQETTNKMKLLKENCKKGAALMSRICPYWREAEWNGLLLTYLDLIEKLSNLLVNNAAENYEERVTAIYESFNRITQDVSAYFSGGIISDKAESF